MKGLHHSVIEIKDTQSSEIEKILVFLRPGQRQIDVDTTRKEAQEILRKVRIGDRIHPRLPRLKIAMLIMALAAARATLLIVIHSACGYFVKLAITNVAAY